MKGTWIVMNQNIDRCIQAMLLNKQMQPTTSISPTRYPPTPTLNSVFCISVCLLFFLLIPPLHENPKAWSKFHQVKVETHTGSGEKNIQHKATKEDWPELAKVMKPIPRCPFVLGSCKRTLLSIKNEIQFPKKHSNKHLQTKRIH